MSEKFLGDVGEVGAEAKSAGKIYGQALFTSSLTWRISLRNVFVGSPIVVSKIDYDF